MYDEKMKWYNRPGSGVRTLVQGRIVFSMAFNVFREPFRKLFVRVEERRHDEVQQRPKLRMVCKVNIVMGHTQQDSRTSAIEFWIGVPVRSNLFLHEKESKLFHRADDELLIA